MLEFVVSSHISYLLACLNLTVREEVVIELLATIVPFVNYLADLLVPLILEPL